MALRLMRGFSTGGLVLGAIFFCASLTPSLVPRDPLVQGALGGVVAAVGYGLWQAAAWLWRWLELPVPERVAPVRRAALIATAVLVVAVMWRAVGWQNSARAAWDLPPVDTIAPLTVAGVAIVVFVILVLLGRVFGWLLRVAARRLGRYLPRKIANALAFVAAAIVFLLLFEGIIFQGVLRLVDSSSRAADAMIAPELAPPDRAEATGSAESLVAWTDLGRRGRSFVATAPTADEISEFWGEPAMDPLRVFVGLTAAGSPEERAQLAFDELIRVGGFDREVLVIAVPTGSGWLDPGAHDPLDYMHRGDIATVAVQYSYLSSWVSLMVDPSYGIRESRALFNLVYEHWSALPADDRPRLYLHGLSLGALLSQSTVPILDVLGDPFDGAMWAGSPFLSDFWRFVVERREPGSPAWRPRFGNDSLIRTMNQEDVLAQGAAPWGPIRLVFLQYASDPIVFFDPSLAFRKPDWLSGERGPDVSPQMRWIPIVTMLQVGFDTMIGLGVPGYGHDYEAVHYIPAWAETTTPRGWTPERERALLDLFEGFLVR